MHKHVSAGTLAGESTLLPPLAPAPIEMRACVGASLTSAEKQMTQVCTAMDWSLKSGSEEGPMASGCGRPDDDDDDVDNNRAGAGGSSGTEPRLPRLPPLPLPLLLRALAPL